MKINFIKLINLIIISFSVLIIFSCKEKAPEPGTEKEQVSIKQPKPSADTTRPKVIYKPAPEKKPEPKLYTVRPGEWLWDISRKEYGTAIGWFRIYEANRAKIKDPDLIYPGQVFVIPEFKRHK